MTISLSSGISVWLFEIPLERRVIASLAATADQAGAFSLWCNHEGGRRRQCIVLKTELIWPGSCRSGGFPNPEKDVLRVGCPWRDMHERYGEWNSVYIRFRRWGRTVRVRCTPCNPVELGLTDDRQHMIDSTTVRGHSQAAGARGGLVRRLLADHAAVLRQKSTPAQAVKNAPLSSPFPLQIPAPCVRAYNPSVPSRLHRFALPARRDR